VCVGTVAFIHGPQGSGKSRMLRSVLKGSQRCESWRLPTNTLLNQSIDSHLHVHYRKYLIIDCRDLHKATSDTQLVGELARQTGYWPVFTFLNSVNNLIDLASVGLIGQKSAIIRSPRFFHH